ncbi:hypothetical protein ACVI1I_006285 [Bradyrhizobium sp. USDA 4459]
MAPVSPALLSVFCNNSFLTPSSLLAPLGNIEVSQLSDLKVSRPPVLEWSRQRPSRSLSASLARALNPNSLG